VGEGFGTRWESGDGSSGDGREEGRWWREGSGGRTGGNGGTGRCVEIGSDGNWDVGGRDVGRSSGVFDSVNEEEKSEKVSERNRERCVRRRREGNVPRKTGSLVDSSDLIVEVRRLLELVERSGLGGSVTVPNDLLLLSPPRSLLVLLKLSSLLVLVRSEHVRTRTSEISKGGRDVGT